jgi:hypothetical protein
MSRILSWVTGSLTPISEWTLLKHLTPKVSMYQASAKQFLDADIKNYTFNRPISKEHVADLYTNLSGMNGAYVLFHNFIVAHCPQMEEENQWLLLDGQHRAEALDELSDEEQENIICMILVITFPKTTQIDIVQDTFQKINYNRGTTKIERVIQQKIFDDFQTLKDLLVKWTKDLSAQGGKISCLTRQDPKPNNVRWKLSEKELQQAIKSHPKLVNKTAEEILDVLKEANTRRQETFQDHLKHKTDDTKRDMFTKRFYIGYDFPKCLSE